jgi:hypothetical protein
MKYITALFFLALVGCGYDLSELNAAKAACANANGKFSTKTWGNGEIMRTYCTIDGVRYRIGRTEYGFHNGVVEK